MKRNHVDTTEQSPTLLSFCTGYGGIERGLELIGIKPRILAHVEIEAYAIANLVKEMEQGRLGPVAIYTDIKTLPMEAFRDRVSILTGGYPCQPFSAAGKRKGKDDPRHLWPYIRDAIKFIRPKIVFFENVEGHISMGLSDVLQDLGKLGYRSTWGIFSAEEVGAPHRRKRVFILAYSESFGGRRVIRELSKTYEGFRESEKHREEERLKSINASKEELGHAKHDGPYATEIARSPEATSRNDSQGTFEPGESERAGRPSVSGDLQEGELADTDVEGLERCVNTNAPRTERLFKITDGCFSWPSRPADPKVLADTMCVGTQGESHQTRREEGQPNMVDNGGHEAKWPARPGEPQYDWEEPRVLVDPIDERLQRDRLHINRAEGRSTDKEATIRPDLQSGASHTSGASREGDDQGEVKPKLGRTTNGPSHRIDRLRQVGNGVVPQTAAVAFMTLIKELDN